MFQTCIRKFPVLVCFAEIHEQIDLYQSILKTKGINSITVFKLATCRLGVQIRKRIS